MLNLILKIKQTVENTLDGNQIALSDEQITSFNIQYDQIVSARLLINPTPERTEGKCGRVKQSFTKNMLDRS
jgi:hypothetical protein